MQQQQHATHVATPASPPGSPAGSAAGALSVKEAIDILGYEDPNSIRFRKLVVDLQKNVQRSDFAEDFLEKDGLNVLIQTLRMTQGNVQGHLLQILSALLVYKNAIEEFAESPELVDKIYSLLQPPTDGEPIALAVAKPALEILIVICGVLENGHKLINQAAKRRVGVNVQPYGPLIGLLSCQDLLTIHNTLLFMNILMKKKKTVSELKAKKLLFRWKECGIMSVLKPLTTYEDKSIAQQLSILQKATNLVIPRSWEEAQKYKTQVEDLRRRYDAASESLFVYQQQQAKLRLLKAELSRAQETIKTMGLMLPDMPSTTHPSQRFENGGGISLSALFDKSMETVDIQATAKEISSARRKLFEVFVTSPEFKPTVEKLVTPPAAAASHRGKKGTAARHADPNDDDIRPPDEDEEDAPPPDGGDDAELPPPPPEEDELPPPPPEEGGETSSAKPAPTPQAAASDTQRTDAPQPQGAASAQPAAPAPAQATVSPTAVAAGYSSPTAPPPPPPPGAFGAPPPAPRFGVPGAAKAAAAADTVAYYKGPAPKKKMKPLHWEKLGLPSGSTMWHVIMNSKDFDCSFDYEEFEAMFSQKEAEAKSKTGAEGGKEKKLMLLDNKTFQNLSIMLHKLPTIPNIQRALLDLDNEILTRDTLSAILAQVPTPELKKSFEAQASQKPIDMYEPPEQFVLMALTMTEFKRRCQAWLFTKDWEDSMAGVVKPIDRMIEAFRSILESKYLPVYFGILLGLGNMMNFGNTAKGNAAVVSVTTLGKLEASKDNRGKISLLQYLINTVKARCPDALELHEELKPIFNSVATLSMDDLEKSVTEAEKELEAFHGHCNAVKKGLARDGTDAGDPFIPKMAEYHVQASEQLKQVQEKFAACKQLYQKVLEYLAVPSSKPLKPEEIFNELIAFTEKVKKVALEVAKDKKRQSRKGQKLDSQLSNVVGRLQEQMVSS